MFLNIQSQFFTSYRVLFDLVGQSLYDTPSSECLYIYIVILLFTNVKKAML